MGWKEILVAEVEGAYGAASGLIELVDSGTLDWRPETGENWMTMGQLLHHLSASCGAMFEGFVRGTWESGDSQTLPSVSSPAAARERLASDRAKALEVLHAVSEADLVERSVKAPWEPTPQPLGFQLSQMIAHLQSHKSQLYYYLKLQGRPVHSGHLWGMS